MGSNLSFGISIAEVMMSQTSDSDRVRDDQKQDASQNAQSSSGNAKDQSNQGKSSSPPQSVDSKSQKPQKSLLRGQLPLPKVKLPKVKLPKVTVSLPRLVKKPYDWLGLLLLMILSSYACVGYFLSILLTIPNRQTLAIAGFSIMALLPILTAFADYELMKWSYLISGILIIGGLYMTKISFHYMFLAVMVWLGITAIAFVGEFLLHKQKHKLFITILILWLPCILGLALGWQIWRLVATNFS